MIMKRIVTISDKILCHSVNTRLAGKQRASEMAQRQGGPQKRHGSHRNRSDSAATVTIERFGAALLRLR
ncbi:hypothetical protein Aduo_003229 [Ancylostoma duodenale]